MRELWILIPLSAIASVAWVIYVVVDGFRRRQQLRLTTDFHGKLLDRIGSAQEFGEFLNTSGGAKFLASLTTEREGGGATGRILRAAQSGLVLLSLGVGLFMIGWWNPLLPLDGQASLNVFGGIAASVGAGLLLSAAASYALSKRMGLIDGEGDRRAASSPHSS
jgi:hypothetical protein